MSTENLKVTEIKRLKQRGKDFVPITLAEAVVVNTQHIPGFSTMEITTLDKILGQYGYNLTQFNQALQNKQNQLVQGSGIVLTDLGDGRTLIDCSLNTTVYKVVTADAFNQIYPNPSKEYTNTIYLVPTEFQDNSNAFAEFICVPIPDENGNDSGIYKWERFGEIQASVDLSNYVTLDLFNSFTAVAVTAINVTTSKEKGEQPVIVSYTIPETLYDNMVATDDTDAIEISQS